MSSTRNWTTVAESQYPWERDAFGFGRRKFPEHEPYRAWANFEFIADDGSINEVDLLVFTPTGFFLVEIKSRPGRVFGDVVNALPPLKVVRLLGNACLSPTTLAPLDTLRLRGPRWILLFSLDSVEPHRVTSNDLVGALEAISTA